MIKRNGMIELELLANVLKIPGEDYFNVLTRCENSLSRCDDHEVWYFFPDFVDYAMKVDLSDMRKLYIHTFWDTPDRSLYAGKHHCGDNQTELRLYRNRLESTYFEYCFTHKAAEADYIPELIRFSGELVDDPQFVAFLSDYLLLPLITLANRIDNRNPYKALVCFVGNMISLDIDRFQGNQSDRLPAMA